MAGQQCCPGTRRKECCITYIFFSLSLFLIIKTLIISNKLLYLLKAGVRLLRLSERKESICLLGFLIER